MDLAILPLRELEAVFFDAGNTLVGMDLDLLAARLEERSVLASPAQIERAEAAARPHVSRRLEQGLSSEARDTFVLYMRRALDRLPVSPGVDLDTLARDLAHDLKTSVPTRRLWSRVLPGVPEALARLRDLGLRLVVVSNSDGTIARGIAEAGLGDLVDAVVDSTVVGVEKPDPRIFEIGLGHSGSRPAATAHVGDLFAVDVLGARAAGIHGVLLDPFDDWVGVPCARARDVAGLAAAIAHSRSDPGAG